MRLFHNRAPFALLKSFVSIPQIVYNEQIEAYGSVVKRQSKMEETA
jgi:hypothetical protein